jgi:hypothetical protein
MSLKATLTGDSAKGLIRGAIWELGSGNYRAYVHLIPWEIVSKSFGRPSQFVSVDGPSVEKVLDAAITRVIAATEMPLQSIHVSRNPHDSEAAEAIER